MSYNASSVRHNKCDYKISLFEREAVKILTKAVALCQQPTKGRY